jgi:hypothetical protein
MHFNSDGQKINSYFLSVILTKDVIKLSHNKEISQFNNGISKRLITMIIINCLVPLLVYMLLRNVFTNDTTALAIAGAIPAIWTLFLWLWRRHI